VRSRLRFRDRRLGVRPLRSQTDGRAQPLRTPRALNVTAAVLIAFVLFWNLTTVSAVRVPSLLSHGGNLLGVDQTWDMFAPSPLDDDGWYVIPATLRDGRTVDVAGVLRGETTGGPVSWRKPADVRGSYDGERWRKYLENLRLHHSDQHPYLARYICREWNGAHPGPRRIESVVIGFVGQRIKPDGKHAPPALRPVWAQQCS
jgi:hypothetical protein